MDKNPSAKDPYGDLGGLCSAPRAKRLAACCSALSFSCSMVSARVLGEKGLERRRFGGRASCQLSRSCVNRLGARRAWGLRRGRAPARRARQLCERQGIWCWEKGGGEASGWGRGPVAGWCQGILWCFYGSPGGFGHGGEVAGYRHRLHPVVPAGSSPCTVKIHCGVFCPWSLQTAFPHKKKTTAEG